MQSDDEEEDDGNEIEYDDFFCRDNDFGSDAESDGEDCTGAIALGTMEKEEILGPQYCSISLPTADAISITQLRDKDGLVYIVDSLNAVVAKTCSSAKCANNSVSWDDFNQSWVAEMEDCDNEPHTYEELIRYTAITFKSVVAPTLLNFSSRVERQKQREKERLEKEQKKAADNLASTSINESGSDGSARAGQSSKSKEYFSDEKV